MLTDWLFLMRASAEWSPWHGCLSALWGFAAVMAGGGTCALVALLLKAIERSGLTELQACQEMGISQSQWCAQKAGEQHVSVQRIGRLPMETLAEFAALVYDWAGPLPGIESAASLHFGTKRMARMELHRTERKGVA